VELSIESTGAKTVTFRGGKEKGKIKLLVDGVAINNTYRGSMYHYLDFPAELVDRIEVIRGPGSVLYGSNAINGVINIVTKNQTASEGTALFAAIGSYNLQKAGFARTDTIGSASLGIDGYYRRTDKALDAGSDKSGYKGETDEALQDYTLGLFAHNEHWQLGVRTKKSNEGFAYGPGNYLERRTDRDGLTSQTTTAELQYKHPLAEYDLVSKLGYKSYLQAFDTRYLPDAIVSLLPASAFGGAGLGDLIYRSEYLETGAYLDLSLQGSPFEGNDLIVGLYADKTEVVQHDLKIYRENDPATGYLSQNLLLGKTDRTVTALYLQESVALGEKADITAGIRLDHYSDYGDSLSPRLAAVYRLNEKQNLKAMYSRAFRAPSWVELYGSIPTFSIGNPDLEAETSDTVEIGFVHKKDIDNLLRFNLFYTNVNDIIYRQGGTYIQDGVSHFYGSELELRARIGLYTTLIATLSTVDGLDKDDEAVADIANQTAGLRLSHKFKNRVVSGTALKYVSSVKRAPSDPRNDLAGYATLDQTFSYRFANGMGVSASVKNLLDADVRYPAPVNTYPDDYPREGRTFWLKAFWEI
jgi:iron complex outermembrane receptor protein